MCCLSLRPWCKSTLPNRGQPSSARKAASSRSSIRFCESLEDLDNLPAPEIIAREIVDDLTAALAQFEAVAIALEGRMQEDR
jgi:hypothetical protein